MARKSTFGISGAKEMEKLLTELGPEVARRVGQTAVRAGAMVIVEEAKRLVPVRTGELRASITAVSVKTNEEKQVTAEIGFLKPTSRRAHLTEFGTATQAAHPFMRPAMDAKAGEALEEMGKVLGRGIDREAKKLAKPG